MCPPSGRGGRRCRWWTERRAPRRGRPGPARAAGRCRRGSPRRRGRRSPRPRRPRRRGRGSGVPSGRSTRACSSTTRPPWVWNSAGTTRTAANGGRSARLHARAAEAVLAGACRRPAARPVGLLRAAPRGRPPMAAARSPSVSPQTRAPLSTVCRKSVKTRLSSWIRWSKTSQPSAPSWRRAARHTRSSRWSRRRTGDRRQVHHEAAAHDRRPADQRRATLGERSVPLVGVEERRRPRRAARRCAARHHARSRCRGRPLPAISGRCRWTSARSPP